MELESCDWVVGMGDGVRDVIRTWESQSSTSIVLVFSTEGIRDGRTRYLSMKKEREGRLTYTSPLTYLPRQPDPAITCLSDHPFADLSI